MKEVALHEGHLVRDARIRRVPAAFLYAFRINIESHTAQLVAELAEQRKLAEQHIRFSQQLRIVELKKSFGSVEVLRGVSFEVARGQVVSVVGDNGANVFGNPTPVVDDPVSTPDRTAPTLRARILRLTKRGRNLRVRVKASERSTLCLHGRIGGRRLKARTVSLRSGVGRTVYVRIPGRAVTALRTGRRLRASVAVAAWDGAGNVTRSSCPPAAGRMLHG